MSQTFASAVATLGLILCAVGRVEALTPVNPGNGCGQILNTPGEYVLTGDLTCSGAVTGIFITSNDVVFHLAGRTISNTTCNPDVGFAGIFVIGPTSGVRIDGGTISGFNDGIILFTSSSQVRGMKVKNACFFGIAVAGQSNWLDKNVVTGSMVDGIGLGQANGTVLTANDISGNVRAGVGISNFSNGNIVFNNIVNDNGVNEGFGIAVFNGQFNLILHNVVNDNFTGIGLSSPGNLAEGNNVHGSTGVGVAIASVGMASAVRLNTVLGSGVTDMSDGTAACGGNLWESNTFETDLVLRCTGRGSDGRVHPVGTQAEIWAFGHLDDLDDLDIVMGGRLLQMSKASRCPNVQIHRSHFSPETA